jgi:prephenate dehydratase
MGHGNTADADRRSSPTGSRDSPRPAPTRAGYLGPRGTFSEEALLASAIPGTVEAVPFRSIYETVAALRRDQVRYAIVPVEN